MRPLFILILASIYLCALNLSEAVDRALQESPKLKEKSYLIKASQEEQDIAWAGFKPKLDLSYAYSEFSKKSFVGADSASLADATLHYNLFNGFSDFYHLKQAQSSEDAARYTYKAAEADLRLQVNLAYVNYLRRKQQIRITEENIALLTQQLKDARNFYEHGLFAKNDYLQVEVELSHAQQRLLESHKEIKLAFFTLKRLLGTNLMPDEPFEEIQREPREVILSELEEKMLLNRSELKLLQAQKEGLGYAYDAAASPYYPKVDIQAKYQMAGVDPIPDGGRTFQINEQTTTTLRLSWNIYQGGEDESKRAALLYQEHAGNERLNELYLQLQLQLEEASEDYALARNKIAVAAKALQQAEENFRITKNQFDANIATTSLMLDAQKFLTQAQTEYHNAHFQLYDTMSRLERVVEEEIF